MASSTVRSEDFWFEDGDIVLSVTEDGTEHQFRVHRAILTIASPVLRDMLSMHQPVTFQDDSVEDVTALLGALYVGRNARIVTADIALAILRLSHKYQLGGLQKVTTQKLLEDWPVKHSEYIARLRFLGSPVPRILQACRLIETAQRCQVSELLPTAFYELACAWGTQWPDIKPHLSHENVARMWVGRARLERRMKPLLTLDTRLPPSMWTTPDSTESSVTIFQYRQNFADCNGRYAQRQHVRVLRNDRLTSMGFCFSVFPSLKAKLGERVLDGVFVLTSLQQFRRRDLGATVCESCKDWFMEILANKTQEVWESIPAEFFQRSTRTCTDKCEVHCHALAVV